MRGPRRAERRQVSVTLRSIARSSRRITCSGAAAALGAATAAVGAAWRDFFAVVGAARRARRRVPPARPVPAAALPRARARLRSAGMATRAAVLRGSRRVACGFQHIGLSN